MSAIGTSGHPSDAHFGGKRTGVGREKVTSIYRWFCKRTPGAAELGPCLTDATRESCSRRTVRVFAAMLRAERVTQQSSRPF